MPRSSEFSPTSGPRFGPLNLVPLTILTALLVSNILATQLEELDTAANSILRKQSVSLWFNLLSTVVIFCLTSTDVSPTDPAENNYDGLGAKWESRVATNLVSLITIFADQLVDRPTWLSTLQIVAWLGAVVFSISPTTVCNGLAQITLPFREKSSQTASQHSWIRPLFKLIVNLFLIFSMTVIIPLFYKHTPRLIPRQEFGSQIPNIATNYTAPADFDIVVSYYDEDLSNLKSLVDKVIAINQIKHMHRRLIIYNKNTQVELSVIKAAMRTDEVTLIPNIGREGATYLHHIITEWDNLAKHTMFIQGRVHDEPFILFKLSEYFIPESQAWHSANYPNSPSTLRSTGFLPLCFSTTCRLDDCADPWTWHDEWSLVPQIHSRITNHTLALASPAAAAVANAVPQADTAMLTYQGQFVSSAQRIRGIPKDLYSYLLTGLTDPSPNSWGRYKNTPHRHKWSANPGHTVDSLAQPILGYAIERVWGTLMQCNSARISWYCASSLGMEAWRHNLGLSVLG